MKLYVSTGNSRMDKKFNGAVMEYDDFAKRLSQTTYTAETMEQYRKLPKGKQDDIKDVGGFVLHSSSSAFFPVAAFIKKPKGGILTASHAAGGKGDQHGEAEKTCYNSFLHL